MRTENQKMRGLKFDVKLWPWRN